MNAHQVYIAAPFFTPEQLATVINVEKAVENIAGLTYYSPRKDGILKDMTPEARRIAGPRLFKLNVEKILESKALVCILDDKDVGTAWEMGFAFSLSKTIIGYTTSTPTLNIMLQQCVHAHAYRAQELTALLQSYAAHGKLPYAPPPVHNVG